MNKTNKAAAAKAEVIATEAETDVIAATQETATCAVAQPMARLGEQALVRSAGLMVDAQGLPYPAQISSKGILVRVDAYVLRCLSRGDMTLI